MSIYILSVLSVVLFCLTLRQLIKTVIVKPNWTLVESGYSFRAHRVERAYKIMAYGLLASFLFLSMLSSFVATFTEIPG